MKPDFSTTKAFIFDLDGTLIDSEKYHADGFAFAVEAASGYKITAQERREFFESHTTRYTPVLAARHGLALDVDDVLAKKREYVKTNFKTETFPDALEFVGKWRGKKRMALASNSPLKFVANALEDIGLSNAFETVCTADDVTHRKPEPEMYLLTLRRMNLAPSEVFVFEDSPAGVTAAQSAGCPVVMVENGAGRAVDGVKKYLWKELSQL